MMSACRADNGLIGREEADPPKVYHRTAEYFYDEKPMVCLGDSAAASPWLLDPSCLVQHSTPSGHRKDRVRGPQCGLLTA